MTGEFSQDFREAELRSGDGANGGRGGDIASYNSINHSNNSTVYHTTIHVYDQQASISGQNLGARQANIANNEIYDCPQFIVNSDGQTLDLSVSDMKSVLSHSFHGGLNQQWVLRDDRNGGVTIMSIHNQNYLAFKTPGQDAELVLSKTPFSWELSRDGKGYKIGVPNSHLGLGINDTSASLRPLYEHRSTRLRIIENTEELRLEIKGWTAGVAGPISTKKPRIASSGVADIVAFGASGVMILRNTLNPLPLLAIADFGYDAGWRTERHVRLLADTTGNGSADIVGFGERGVLISVNNGDNAFQAPEKAISDFCYSAGGWRVGSHLRLMADLRNSGRADIVGFGDGGVVVSLNRGNGSFRPVHMALGDFGGHQSWSAEKHVRLLADLDGNGLLDIVGFGDNHVLTARGNGDGTFQHPEVAISDMCYNKGWRADKHIRVVADLTGDGKPDLVGFGDWGVHVALNNGDGTFQPMPLVLQSFNYEQGWRIENHPRFVADLNGNGCGDIVGFGNKGVSVAFNNGDGTFQPPRLIMSDFSYDSGWKFDEENPRLLADMTGDGRPDIVGFGSRAVFVSYNDGKGNFGPPTQLVAAFGSKDPEWAPRKSVKYVTKLYT